MRVPELSVALVLGCGCLGRYWEQLDRPKFAPDACSLADPCGSGPTGGALSLPQDQSSAHTRQMIASFSSGGWAGEKQME